ncbi:MAG: nnr 1 [Phycisphaerales bacterium]|nr:nnr 1 [Phycisphaerales bacterium]
MSDGIVRLTRRQVREVDRRAIENYGIPGIVLMENAARGAAEVAWEMLDRRPQNVTIICGGGNNGGDGLAIARHLHNHGANVQVLLAIDPEKYIGDAAINWRIVQSMGLDVAGSEDAAELVSPLAASMIIDALFGTGLTQPPRADAQALIQRMNASTLPILSIDLPSGLDCDTGEPLDACVRATQTVTFVAEKAGFANPESRHFTGDITIVDIGCPRELIDEVLRM